MSAVTERSRGKFIKRLKEMGFNGPQELTGKKFMIYHGKAFVIPNEKNYSVAQFRFLLQELERVVSQEAWQR